MKEIGRYISSEKPFNIFKTSIVSGFIYLNIKDICDDLEQYESIQNDPVHVQYKSTLNVILSGLHKIGYYNENLDEPTGNKVHLSRIIMLNDLTRFQDSESNSHITLEVLQLPLQYDGIKLMYIKDMLRKIDQYLIYDHIKMEEDGKMTENKHTQYGLIKNDLPEQFIIEEYKSLCKNQKILYGIIMSNDRSTDVMFDTAFKYKTATRSYLRGMAITERNYRLWVQLHIDDLKMIAF
jgi:hypothetical protein